MPNANGPPADKGEWSIKGSGLIPKTLALAFRPIKRVDQFGPIGQA